MQIIKAGYEILDELNGSSRKLREWLGCATRVRIKSLRVVLRRW